MCTHAYIHRGWPWKHSQYSICADGVEPGWGYEDKVPDTIKPDAWGMGSMTQLNFLVSWRSNKNAFGFKPRCWKRCWSTQVHVPAPLTAVQRIERDRFILLWLRNLKPHCRISQHQSAFRSAVDVEGVGSLGEWTLMEPISCFCVCVWFATFSKKEGWHAVQINWGFWGWQLNPREL